MWENRKGIGRMVHSLDCHDDEEHSLFHSAVASLRRMCNILWMPEE